MNKTLIAGLVLSTFSVSALAASPNYDKLEFGYHDGDDFHVYSVAGSASLSDAIFLRGNYSYSRDDLSFVDTDGRLYGLGLGYRTPLTPSLDFNAVADYLHSKLETEIPGLGSASDSDDGYRVGAGLRAMATDALELSAIAYHYDIFEDDYATMDAQATYNFTKAMGAYAGYEQNFDDHDLSVWKAGVRFSF
ncbi:MAG: porin family protein [Gammaproteobacteria bacterium]|nr:porin family protein [Gammaproteobacteria bacterium]